MHLRSREHGALTLDLISQAEDPSAGLTTDEPRPLPRRRWPARLPRTLPIYRHRQAFPDSDGKYRVYEHQVSAKHIDLTVERYSNTIITSTLGLRKITV